MMVIFIVFLLYVLLIACVYFSVTMLMLIGLNMYAIGFVWLALAISSSAYLMMRGR